MNKKTLNTEKSNILNIKRKEKKLPSPKKPEKNLLIIGNNFNDIPQLFSI